VRRIGTNGSTLAAVKLVKEWDKKAAAIGLGVLKDHYKVGSRRFIAKDSARLMAAAHTAPGHHGWPLGRYFSGMGGAPRANATGQLLQQRAGAVLFGPDRLQAGHVHGRVHHQPAVCRPPDAARGAQAAGYAGCAQPLFHWCPLRQRLDLPTAIGTGPVKEWTRFVLRKAMQKASVIVAPVHELDDFGLEELAGKTIITSTVNDERMAQLRDKGVATVIDGSPCMHGHVLGAQLLDAMILAATGKQPREILEDDYLEIITGLQQEPRIVHPNGYQRVNRFAFVIHPLSQEYFKKVKPIELLSQVSPPVMMNSLEKIMAYAPPFVYSKVTGIESPTGVKAEGWLISVGGTPKEIMRHDPEFTYRRLLDAAAMAKRLGAQIMGLGAFTKVVGDAGVTVAKRAPLPITTGNSYSASGALWAAHDALLAHALCCPRPKGKQRVQCKGMVVGATGAIGSVCARLMARAVEEVYMVSPETAKLLELKESILKESPDAKIFLSAQADKDIADMDMIVTATSGAGKKVLDIMKVKPGCVITDVARPLDLPASEVAKRPDVLVIESGEIQLPGDVQMKNIGLPRGLAYACLAETIVLALEGRFENFTVGRAIEWEKVREIYQLGLKHGMKLAAISGVNGPFSDADIARVRELALVARAEQAGGKAKVKSTPVKPVAPKRQHPQKNGCLQP
jgi:predicted amino acid dehydrogenase